MLAKATDVAKGEATYTYNGMGKRIAVVNPEEKIEYLLDLTKDYHNMLERSVNGETEVYTYDSNVVSMSKAGNDYFYMLDELGTGMYLTGTDGIATTTYAYDEFGRNLNPYTGKREKPSYTKQGNIIQPLAFTGYQHDEMTGSYFAQARYYNSDAGRFDSKDSERYRKFHNMNSMNLYVYCQNTPCRFIDPTGHIIYTPVEGYEAHIIMEDYAKNMLGADVELMIEGGSFHGTGLFGKADIVDLNGLYAEIYEIKPVTYSKGMRRQLAYSQLERHFSAFNNPSYSNMERNGKLGAIEGQSYTNQIDNLYFKSTIHENMYIQYYASGDGLIFYRYVESEKVPEKHIEAMVSSDVRQKLEIKKQKINALADKAVDFLVKGVQLVCLIGIIALIIDTVPGDEEPIPFLLEIIKDGSYIKELLMQFGIKLLSSNDEQCEVA